MVFDRLHPGVQDWVGRQGWREIKRFQIQAFAHLLDTTDDLIVAAATAEGKTEAVWLPIISHLATAPGASAQALCVSPLKALINDQWKRFEHLCAELEIPVHRWHGDVAANKKKGFRARPGGIVLITPESLESNFINYGPLVRKLYRDLEFVVIDELHSFLENERGIHLRSLLSRLVADIGRTPRLIGLSATLSDATVAKSFLREDPERVALIEGPKGERSVKIALHGLVCEGAEGGILPGIAADLATRCQGSTNLVFANSRQTVEDLASHLATMADRHGQENPFLVHHGSLAKGLREQAEARLKSGQPVTAVCTSTLELGIDIGSVEGVFQVDPPHAVSALVQRLGRSGRRPGDSAILHLYTRDAEGGQGISTRLYPELLRGIATIELMLQGWLEPCRVDGLHLSTLVHQILSVLKQTGGETAQALHRILCSTGPFRRVTTRLFDQVLRDIARSDLIDQAPGGELLLGLAGERIVNAPGFYAAFETPRHFTVQHQGRSFGLVSSPWDPVVGACLVLAGAKWAIEKVDARRRTIEVRPSATGVAQPFLGLAGEVHTQIYQQMHHLLVTDRIPAYLNKQSRELLDRGRDSARELGLVDRRILFHGQQVHWFPWLGTRGRLTLALLARRDHVEVRQDSLCLTYKASPEQFRYHLQRITDHTVNEPDLAGLIDHKPRDRFDRFLSESLLDLVNAERRLAISEAVGAAASALQECQSCHGSGLIAA